MSARVNRRAGGAFREAVGNGGHNISHALQGGRGGRRGRGWVGGWRVCQQQNRVVELVVGAGKDTGARGFRWARGRVSSLRTRVASHGSNEAPPSDGPPHCR